MADDNNTLPANEKALKMMQKMGYKTGSGLGKNEQGVTEAVKMQFNLGKRGLGLHITNLNISDDNWDFSREEIDVEEKIHWLENGGKNIKIDEEWLKEGVPNHDIENECDFCDENVLKDVFTAKRIFDELDELELRRARAKANPFESIRSVFFMNRAALKMANVDAATDHIFTNIDKNPNFLHEKGPFYFADVCAGPGGFTEYILWRRRWFFKGFGLTLKDDNDFKVGESSCACAATFQPLYGKRGDGDVRCPDNIVDFVERVKNDSEGKGVHFMMSDGGFSVEGNENIQEILSKNIYICQCLLSLEIVRKHGHFVTKIFDVFTPFSVGLLYLMYLCYEKVAILKPNSSRPANSERYFIAYGLKHCQLTKNIRKYLWEIVKKLWEIKDNDDLDVLEIVPVRIIQNDNDFYSYIVESNNSIGKKQIIALEKLSAFCRNPNLIDARQIELRKQCLEYWEIPDRPRAPVENFKLENLLLELNLAQEILRVQSREISKINNLQLTVNDITDWHYAPMFSSSGTNRCNFYAGLSSSKVYRLQGLKWVKVKDMQLVRGTLLYGEFVKEKIINSTSKDNFSQRYSLHVIDALQLGDMNLSHHDFEQRSEFIELYCKSVNKEAQAKYTVRIRPKVIQKLQNFSLETDTIKTDKENGGYYSELPVLGFGTHSESYELNSIMLLKTNENQSFQSTYVLRAQINIKHEKNENENAMCLEDIQNFVQKKININ